MPRLLRTDRKGSGIRLRARGDHPGSRRFWSRQISIHALVRGRTGNQTEVHIPNHISTPASREGELSPFTEPYAVILFQLPPSREGERRGCLKVCSGCTYFNSRPRVKANGKSAHSTNILTVHIRQNSTFSLAFASLIAAVRGGGGANGACPLRVPPRVFCVGGVRAQKSRGCPASTLALLPR